MSTAALSTHRGLLAAACATVLTITGLGVLPAGADDSLTWRSTTFGQSVDLSFSSNVLPEKVGVNATDPQVPGTIEGEIFMESRGGKLAPGHDGLTFYHVELDPREHNFVLDAQVVVSQLGPETGASANGQEGAGLMVRDLNGPPRQDPMVPGFEEYPAAANLAGTTMMRQGPAPLVRTGVTEPWGTVGSQRHFSPWASGGPCHVVTDVPVRMTLERTDEAFVSSAAWIGTDGSECSYSRTQPGADLVQVQDDGSMTVGFFASRNVAVTFSDASLTLSPAATVASPQAPEPVREMALQNLSPERAGSTDYPVAVRSTQPGTLDVTAAGEPVVTGAPVPADEVFTAQVSLPNGSTDLSLTFTPADGPDLTPVTRDWTVTVREFGQADLVAAATGTPDGDGTAQAPLDVHTAVRHVGPGGSVLLRGGTYELTSAVQIAAAYRGSAQEPKTLRPMDGEQVILDAGRRASRALVLDADHWHVQGLAVTRSTGNGMRVSGSYNVIQDMVFHHNGDSGFQLSGSGADPARWPAGNLILNSESHDNRDAGDINADGFAAKLGVGPGNVFRGNIAHHNIDDGWDLYNRLNEGANFPILLEGNIAHSNGRLSDGYNADGSTGVGFKLGGEGLPVAHVVTGNLAYDNNMDGFSDNFNPGRMELTNNTAVDNRRYNVLLRSSPYFEPQEQGVLRNTLSLGTSGRHSTLPEYADAVAADTDATNYLWDGHSTVNAAGRVVGDNQVLTRTLPTGWDRDEDGTIVHGGFVQPRWNSFLATAGTGGSHVGAVRPATKPGNPHPGPPGLRPDPPRGITPGQG